VRQSGSGENFDSDWTLGDLKASGSCGIRKRGDFPACFLPLRKMAAIANLKVESVLEDAILIVGKLVE
jgi:hypothetical protein